MSRNRIAVVLLSLLFLPSCAINTLKNEGLVLLVDDSYQASVFETNRDGISSPDGLLWRKGKFYLADEGGIAVRVWSKEQGMKTLCDARLGIMSPEDLVIDGDGNIYFTDDDAGGVWEIEANGKARLLAGKDKGLISTEGIALSPEGNILVGDGKRHEVFSVSKSGEVSVFLGPEYGIKKPESMVFDEQGNLYIADNQQAILYLLDTKHELRRLIEQKDGFSPETIFYSQGTLYITDSDAGKLYRFTAKEGLQTIAVFSGKLKNVQGITADDRGDLYVSVQSDLKHKVGYVVKISKGVTGEKSVAQN